MLKREMVDLDFVKIFRNFVLDPWGKSCTLHAFPFLVSRRWA